MNNYKQQLRTFWYLLIIDFFVIFKGIWGEVFDTCLWVTLSIICNGYVMPMLGTSLKYGSLLAIGQLVSCGIFLMYHSSNSLVGDFINDKAIAYELMLPISSWLVFARRSISLALKAMMLSIVILPIAKITLGNLLDLSYFSIHRFLLSFILVNFACGCGAVFLASVNNGFQYSSRVWVRYVFPLWFLGGSIFPYNAMAKAFPFFGKALLLNPIVYATELMKASILAPEAYSIPFWTSFTVLLLCSLLLFTSGYLRLRKRFDFI